jgi:murein DD-endopeptidase MepM/ murein hydrolase activator NlpD
MEYEVLIKNIFNRDAVIEQLKGGRSLLGFFGGGALNRPYLSGTNSTFSPAVLSRLHRANIGRPPVHETGDYALYYLSSLGGMEKDYYRIDSRTLLYDRHLRWSYWESPLTNVTSGSGHIMPFDNPVVTSEFGPRWGKKHGGVDMAHSNATMTNGLAVRATMSGRVVKVVYHLDGDAGGIRVALLAKNGYRYNYYHLQIGSNLHIVLGKHVNQKDIIGKIGGTGFMREKNYVPHLHYEIWKDNDRSQRITPEKVHSEIAKLPRR